MHRLMHRHEDSNNLNGLPPLSDLLHAAISVVITDYRICHRRGASEAEQSLLIQFFLPIGSIPIR